MPIPLNAQAMNLNLQRETAAAQTEYLQTNAFAAVGERRQTIDPAPLFAPKFEAQVATREPLTIGDIGSLANEVKKSVGFP